jgi:FtsP/CotA-like multicopper oxidase with cupredoxin domain
MRTSSLWIVSLFGALALASPLAAAPALHAFEPPPMLPGQAELLAAPEALTSAGGCQPQGSMARNGDIVYVLLNFVRGRFTINNPDPTDPQKDGEDPVELRSYGGCKSGPAVYVKPGDTLRIDLVNRTDKDDPSCLENPPSGLSLQLTPGVSCFNTTNLHTHGLHVSPAGNSDNVLLNIGPQTNFPYEINIPADHPAGTFWYHAHRHGSTAVQVASGASGILIVKGSRQYAPPTPQNPYPRADIDTVLHNSQGAPLKEQLFLFQQIAYACFDNEPDQPGGPWQQIYTAKGLYNINSGADVQNAPWTCPLASPGHPVTPGAVENFALQLDSPSIWDTSGRFTSINGTVQPTITVSAGEIQRWRFVHAGIHDTINVQIVRASPMGAANLIAASSLSGNRQQQKADLAVSCAATPDTLIPQFEIASDGLTRAKIHTIRAAKIGDVLESNYLQPGYRSDILVAFPAAGDYCLLDQAAPAPERVSNGPGGQGPSTPQLLAYIHVRGGQTVTTDLQDYIETSLYDANPQLPSTVRSALRGGDLSPWAPFKDLSPATKPDVQHANFVIHFPAFQINGTSYDPNIVNITRQVNTSDDWILTSEGEPHIFHIHINPFEVIDVTKNDATGQQTSIFNQDGTCRADSVVSDKQGLADQYCGMHHVFRDTVIVENNYQVHIRTRYDRYIGEYVLHCHILDHEDSGMMLNIAIVPDLKAPGGGLGMPFMRRTMLGTEPPSPKRSDLNYGFWPICRGGAANRNRSLAN